MFKSIRKGGRIAAVALGLVAALTPLATPPAALADGAPTPELEKSYTLKNKEIELLANDGKHAIIRSYQRSKNEDDDYSITGYSLLDLSDGSTKDIDVPKNAFNNLEDSTEAGCITWFSGNNLVVYSIDDNKTSTHSIKTRSYEDKRVTLSVNGKVAAVEYENDDYDTEYIDVFNLDTDKVIASYKWSNKEGKRDNKWTLSNDGKRLYVISSNESILKTLDTSNGSIKTQAIPPAIDLNKEPNSNNLLIGAFLGNALAKADYDGNVEILDNGQSFIFAVPYGDYILAEKGRYKKNGEIDETSSPQYVLLNNNGNEVRTLNSTFLNNNFHLIDVSKHGDVMLVLLAKRIGTDSDDDDINSYSLYTADTDTGQKTKLPIKTNSVDEFRYIDGDQKILAIYEDKKDSDKLHIDIYKSNIPHSVIDDALYFAQNNLPVVIGGGVVLVLIIGGVVVVCVRRRKKRSGSKDDASGTAPKTKKQKCGRRRKKGQQEDASTSSADVATQQTVNQPAAPAAQPNVAPTASPATAQQPPAAVPQQPAPQPPAVAASAPRFCRHCGSPLTPGSKFCPKCGHPVE